jgi:hypothetical protein
MLAPAAFALRLIPYTRQYSSQWWGLFSKYLIWGPVAAFFIFLSEFTLKTRTVSSAGFNTIAGDINIDFLIICAFLYAGYAFARKSGMIGANYVTSFVDKFAQGGSVVAQYIGRGSALKHIGSAIEGKTGFGGVRKVGEEWVKRSQQIQALPGSTKKIFSQFGKDYDKGVGKQERAQVRTMARFLPKGFDAESLEKDDVSKWDADEAYNVIKQRIKDKKFKPSDFRELLPNMSKRTARGLVKLMQERPEGWEDGHSFNLSEAMKKKLGLGELDGAQLSVINEGDPIPADFNGFILDNSDPDDKYKMRVKGEKPGKNKKPGRPYEFQMDRTYNNDLSDFGTEDQENKRENEYKIMVDKFNRTIEAGKALGSDPDAENKLRQRAFTTKDIFAPEEIDRVREEIKDKLGVNLRVDMDPKWGSLLSRSGQRVILSSKVAGDERIDMDVNEGRYYSKENIGDLVKTLRESGDMSESDIQKLIAAAELKGGIQAVRGVPRTHKKALEEVVNLKLKTEPAQVRFARQNQGNHEGMHSVLNYISRSNRNLYQNIIKTITTFDAKNFEALEKEIREFKDKGEQPYKNISKERLVEEIITNKKFASKMSGDLIKQVNDLLNPAIKSHKELRFKAGREVRAEDRVKVLSDKLEKRNQEVPEAANKFDFEV